VRQHQEIDQTPEVLDYQGPHGQGELGSPKPPSAKEAESFFNGCILWLMVLIVTVPLAVAGIVWLLFWFLGIRDL
jgi:hypothetical protein